MFGDPAFGIGNARVVEGDDPAGPLRADATQEQFVFQPVTAR